VRTVPSYADALAACAILLADLRGDREGVAALLEGRRVDTDLVAGFGACSPRPWPRRSHFSTTPTTPKARWTPSWRRSSLP
jgi:hypothetical protein